MTLIPEATLKDWRRRATSRTKEKLSDLLDLRDIIVENEAKGREVVAQIKVEAAGAMLCSRSSIERSLWILRDYPAFKLLDWTYKGFGFDHIEAANRLYSLSQYDNPAELLDAALEFGNANGKTMTVPEFENFILGHLPPLEISKRATEIFTRFMKFSGKLATLLKWDKSTRAEFERELSDLWARYAG